MTAYKLVMQTFLADKKVPATVASPDFLLAQTDLCFSIPNATAFSLAEAMFPAQVLPTLPHALRAGYIVRLGSSTLSSPLSVS